MFNDKISLRGGGGGGVGVGGQAFLRVIISFGLYMAGPFNFGEVFGPRNQTSLEPRRAPPVNKCQK